MPTTIPSSSSVFRQNELQEMLGHPPGWILRSGISLIGGFILVVLTLSWLIRYPDELPAQITILQATPPHEIRPLITARLDTFLYTDGANVKAGDRILLLEDAADWQDVDLLWMLLQQEDKLSVEWPETLVLGALQPDYAAFLDACNNLRFFKRRMIFRDRREAILDERASLEKLEKVYTEQKKVFLAEQQFIQLSERRTQSLFEDGVSSRIELEEEQKRSLQYEQQLKNLEISLLQNRLSIQQLEASLAENEDEFLRTENDLQLQLLQVERQLTGAIEEWYKQFILTSPISGKLEWNRQLAQQYLVQSGELLALIVSPSIGERSFAQLRLPAAGIGKVELGTPVTIKLDAYPAHEFGQLRTKVDEIHYVPTENSEAIPEYTLKVFLSDTLVTSYGKKIVVKPNMSGSASVITKDRRILERILQQFMDVFKNT